MLLACWELTLYKMGYYLDNVMFHGLLARDCQILAFHVGLALTTGICQSPPSEHDIVKLLRQAVKMASVAPKPSPCLSILGGNRVTLPLDWG
jgi:hypothetical protein